MLAQFTTDLRLRRQRRSNINPPTYPITTQTTKTMNRRVDCMIEVRSVAVSDTATERRAIATFKKIESGNPLSRTSSSVSETS
jgi:hypothetical protein